MSDVRPHELEYRKNTLTYLSELFPDKIKVVSYQHPAYGEKFALEFVGTNQQSDLEDVNEMVISFYSNHLEVKTSLRTYSFPELVKDETLINTQITEPPIDPYEIEDELIVEVNAVQEEPSEQPNESEEPEADADVQEAAPEPEAEPAETTTKKRSKK